MRLKHNSFFSGFFCHFFVLWDVGGEKSEFATYWQRSSRSKKLYSFLPLWKIAVKCLGAAESQRLMEVSEAAAAPCPCVHSKAEYLFPRDTCVCVHTYTENAAFLQTKEHQQLRPLPFSGWSGWKPATGNTLIPSAAGIRQPVHPVAGPQSSGIPFPAQMCAPVGWSLQ